MAVDATTAAATTAAAAYGVTGTYSNRRFLFRQFLAPTRIAAATARIRGAAAGVMVRRRLVSRLALRRLVTSTAFIRVTHLPPIA
jgi:hypothetical protein